MSSAERPLHILHLASSERWTGAAEPAACLAAEEIRHGHTVEFACIGGSSFERRLKEMKIPFVEGLHFDRRLGPSHLRQDILRLRHLAAAKKPRIIHCHLPHDHWIAALALRRPFSRFQREEPAIVRTMHRDVPPRHDLAHRWLAGKGTDMVIAVCQSQRQALIERVGIPAVKIKWVRGAVDLERFKPGLPRDLIRDECNIPHEALVAGMIARMQPHRGHYWFLETIEEVVKAVPMAFYAMAGRGEIKDELLRRIQDHRFTHHLRRIGYRKDDLPETYAALDVVVMLAPGSDGTCRAMLEAMACGRPVVGARRGAIADTIEPGVNGWLVEPDNRGKLAEALIDALSHPRETQRMGEAARRHVEQHHTREAHYQATLEVYREALERRIAACV